MFTLILLHFSFINNSFCEELKEKKEYLKKVNIGISLNHLHENCLDKDYFLGLSSCFEEHNEKNNKKFEIIITVYDNEGKDIKDVENTKKLIYRNKVIALLGYSNKLGLEESYKFLEDKNINIPILFPFNNEEKFRNDNFLKIFTLKPLIKEEIDILIKTLQNFKRISLIYLENMDAEKIYLKSKIQYENIVSECFYNKEPLKLNNSLLMAKNSNPDAIVFLGDSYSGLNFAKRMVRTNLKNVTFISLGDVVNTKFLNVLSDYNLNIIYTRILKEKNGWEIDNEYKKSLRKFFKENIPTSQGLEAYFVGKILLHALEEIMLTDKELTNENLIEYFKNKSKITILDIEIEKIKNHFSLPLYLIENNINKNE